MGQIASCGDDQGEMLTSASQITDGDTDSWYQAWNGMGQPL